MTSVVDGAHLFTFNDILVDASAHRILRCGVECEVEPKAFAVLLEFVSRPDELLTRDRLLDAVWGHRHVTPGVLNRVVANLRRSLGDDFAHPRYIETVHGLGYRFIAQVRAVAPEQQPIAAAPAMPSTISAPVLQRSAAVPDVRPLRHLAIASLAIVLAAVAAMVVWQNGDVRSTSRGAGASNSLAIVPFRQRGGDANLATSMQALSESLTDTLARDTSLHVAGRTSVMALGSARADPQSVAHTLDVEYVLTGEAQSTADGVALSATLWKRAQAEPVWIDQRMAPGAELFRFVVPLLDRIHSTIAPGARSDMAHASAASVPVQDLYWLGRRYWYERTPASLARALDYFQRAVREDPDFALGYTGIADTYVLLYEYANMPLDEASRRARSAIARAKELAPDLADAYASEGLLLLDEADAPVGAAVAPLKRALELAPHLPNARLWYGDALAYAGRPKEAIAWHEGTLEDDPLNAILHTYLGVAVMLAGDQERATRHFRRAIELEPDYPEPKWQIGLQDEMYGRSAQADHTFRQARQLHGPSGWNSLHLAYAALLRGDADAAEAVLADVGDDSIDRFEALAWVRWQQQVPGLREVLSRIPERESNARLRLATLARIDLDEGRKHDALENYARIFAADPERADPFFRPWLPTLGLGHFAAWIALLPPQDPVRARALDAYAKQLNSYVEGGVRVPPLKYHFALLAALRENASSAEQGLASALGEGWLDATSLDRDPGWAPYRNTNWFRSAQETLRVRANAERMALMADAPASVPQERSQ